ncbi:MAG TPA: CPBP family intramembrane metalloprotease [Opitutaceae bacterium]|nr:CPBP family intramembrane metalloprotease [Opitutaceae bacterium]HRJ46029.1 CPBP family intramembrane metalloprotease [Opitutaceae bacterium]
MNDHPLLLLLMIGAGVYVAYLWRSDCQAAQAGRPNPGALPGTAPASRRMLILAASGALALLALETWGEIRLGIASEQSRLTLFFALYTLSAAIVEEVIFRGYLVIRGRGTGMRWVGILAASAVFALLHPFLWQWEEGFQLTLGLKGWFSTGMIFLGSLWFYAVRFAGWNPAHSLLPCFVAHLTKNLGVIAIKAQQGFIDGWW